MHFSYILIIFLPSFSFFSFVSLDKSSVLTATSSINLIYYKSLFLEKFKLVINFGINYSDKSIIFSFYSTVKSIYYWILLFDN